ncbi:ABC transporter ATP-binding protein [Dietzia maris]|jgi:iron complex transport system ATP-binding protein|uniref:iron ABC transporter ATP-binding protein n=1 Tax=Dietzia TaxID=37914 RepID=UPI000BDFACCC|nr:MULTISPECIES: ATP-binding cassette domain-containing protein [Dietzia]MCZ4538665.1 ATP-binding cassette domain-containing protein [Dietzia maris]MCZ4655075.1 ATP-binding cassette domain-containing protein [Dietzia kunjamensis]MDV3355158.1 ATP-binding cassette domain-containing protein [Dietzia sp. IN118]
MSLLPFRRRDDRSGENRWSAGCGIEARSVCSSYGDTRVLHDVTACFAHGGVTSLIGPNGAGKSTLLGVMSRLQAADSGTVLVDGVDVSVNGGRELARRLAVLRQENAVSIRLTVRELVGFGRFPHNGGRPGPDDAEHVDYALGAMELEDLADRYLDELSGGQRQRAHIAMVLAQDTDYVLLDEPLNNLDLRHATSIMRLLRRTAAERGKTIVLVIHDINIAAAYSDRIIAMKDGRIVSDGTPAEIMRTDVLKDVYDMEMQVAEVAGRYVALYFDGEDELEECGAALSTA